MYRAPHRYRTSPETEITQLLAAWETTPSPKRKKRATPSCTVSHHPDTPCRDEILQVSTETQHADISQRRPPSCAAGTTCDLHEPVDIRKGSKDTPDAVSLQRLNPLNHRTGLGRESFRPGRSTYRRSR